jgi:hypothetical protein
MSNSVTKDAAREAIDSVIIENGERGITAHSLAGVLHTMVDAASNNTGGGEEILKVKVVEDGEELTETDKEANVLVYQKILNCLRNENIPFVYLMSFMKDEEEGTLLGMMSYLIPVQVCIYAEEVYGTNIVLQYMISGGNMGIAMLQEDGLVQMVS